MGDEKEEAHYLDVVTQFRACCGVTKRHLGSRVLWVQREVLLDLYGYADVGMVAEILTDTRSILHHW